MKPNYEFEHGSVLGEIRNEVYQKYGESAFDTFIYMWNDDPPIGLEQTIYSLVNADTVKFLIAKIVYEENEILKNMQKKDGFLDPNRIKFPDMLKPVKISLEWKDANIPFLTKKELDQQNIEYSL